MAVRGVYTQAEKEMIERTNKTQDMLAGWAKEARRRVATAESMQSTALRMDCWNPLWRDDDYAAGTRWGSIIAHPTYVEGAGPHIVMEIIGGPNSETGFHKQDANWVGEDLDFYRPVYAGDSFKYWRRPHHVEDATPLDGNGPRRYRFFSHDFDVYNQRGELVSQFKNYLQPTYIPERPKEPYFNESAYAYNKEEMEYIDSIAKQEEIRGANIRYWEDVEVGEELIPVVKGPITMREQMIGMGMAGLPMREFVKAWPWELIRDPDLGTVHDGVEIHYSDRIAQLRGFPCAILVGGHGKNEMIRLTTNWMGDDGFLRRFRWRRRSNGAVGDTLIGHGKVVNKRIENGEYLVDLKTWSENIRGMLDSVAVATVSLLSKEGPF